MMPDAAKAETEIEPTIAVVKTPAMNDENFFIVTLLRCLYTNYTLRFRKVNVTQDLGYPRSFLLEVDFTSYPIYPIRNAIVLLTNQCNLACPYCFEERGTSRMSLDTAKDVLKFLHLSKSTGIGYTFFGGEPMLEWDSIIFPLIEWSKDRYPARFNMTTNGTLFTEDRLNYLFNNNVSFLLSMDGGKETQDSNRPMRNKGSSYDAIAKYIPQILKFRPGQTVRMTLNHSSCEHFFEDILSLIELGFMNISAIPDFFQEWSKPEKERFILSLEKYEEYIIDSFVNNKTPVVFFGYREAFHKIAQTLFSEKNAIYRAVDECAKTNQCGFGIRRSVSIDPDGNLYGCHHISPLVPHGPFWLGDICGGLREDLVRKLIDSYQPEKVEGMNCSQCPIDWVCNGGCKPNNYQICGEIHRVPDMYCFWEQTIVMSAYKIACRLGEDRNTLFRSIFLRDA